MEQESSNYYSDVRARVFSRVFRRRASSASRRPTRTDRPTQNHPRRFSSFSLCASIIFCFSASRPVNRPFLSAAARLALNASLFAFFCANTLPPPTGLNRFFPTLHVGHLYDLGNAAKSPLKTYPQSTHTYAPLDDVVFPPPPPKLRNAVAIGRSRLDAGLDTRLDDDDDDIIVPFDPRTLSERANANARIVIVIVVIVIVVVVDIAHR